MRLSNVLNLRNSHFLMPIKVDGLPPEMSDCVLTFVQRCQVAVLVCANEDYAAQVVAIWDCLALFPKGVRGVDLLGAVTAVSRVAQGFFGAPSESAMRARPPMGTRRRRHANAVLKFARERYSRPNLSLALAASELELSVEYLSRALAAETGHSFKRPFRSHLNGIRILAAIQLMQRPMTLNAVAAQVGYSRTGELDRQFERWFRLTPRAFRACLRQDPTRMRMS